MKKRLFFLMIFTFIAIFGETYEKIPFDAAGKILKIDKKLKLRLNLFKEYPNFISAELYKNNGSMVLNIKYEKQQSLYMDLKAFNGEQLQGLQQKLLGIKLIFDQTGRKQLIYSSTLLALGFWGWATNVAFSVNDERLIMANYMFIVGGSFFAPFYLTKDMNITIAESRLFAYGGTRGIFWGIFMEMALETPDLNAPLALSVTSALGGYFLSKKLNMAAGTVESIGVWGDMGLLWGLGIGSLLDEDNIINEKDSYLFPAVISMANCLTGYFYGKNKHYTIGDGYMLRSFATWGSQLGFFISDLSDSMDNVKISVPVSITTSLAAMIAGDLFFRGKTHYNSSDGFLIMLSEGVGSLLGAGFVYIADSKSKADPYVYFGVSTLTGAISAYLVKKSLK
ncbi:hypothetical protein J7L48_07140 [bacterium]|nr:hypothetical protein [bacterium]